MSFTAKIPVLACDLGGSKLASAIFNHQGMSDYKNKFIADLPYLEQIDTLIQTIASYKEHYPSLGRVGISIAGLVDKAEGKVSYYQVDSEQDVTQLEYQTIELVNLVKEKTGLAAQIESDSAAAVIAEWKAGSAKGRTNVACLTLGTLLGFGVVVNGEIVYPRTGSVILGGIPFAEDEIFTNDDLGHRASGSGLHKITKALGNKYQDSRLYSLVGQSNFTGKQVAKLATAGDTYALEAFSILGYWVGIATVSAINMYGPEVVALAGGLSESMELWYPTAQQVIDKYSIKLNFDKAIVCQAEHKNHAPLVGASIIARDG